MSDSIQLTAQINDDLAGKRLDQAAAILFQEYSRSQLQEWIKEGNLSVDGKIKRPKDKLLGGEVLRLNATPEIQGNHAPEAIPLVIVYEDSQIMVINKPAGLVVHPAAGNPNGTLLNALLHYYPDINQLPRAGIVHRLDKDTTGLMVVAKTLTAQTHLVRQLQSREMGREYEALVQGVMTGGGIVEQPLGRHPVTRQKMAVTPQGKPAVTHYRLIKKLRAHTHIGLKLETGRTHQIRVHMAYINYPLVGDQVYGGRFRIPELCSTETSQTLSKFKRQALHARKLTLTHPKTHEELSWEVELPKDMQQLLEVLQTDFSQHSRSVS